MDNVVFYSFEYITHLFRATGSSPLDSVYTLKVQFCNNSDC